MTPVVTIEATACSNETKASTNHDAIQMTPVVTSGTDARDVVPIPFATVTQHQPLDVRRGTGSGSHVVFPLHHGQIQTVRFLFLFLF